MTRVLVTRSEPGASETGERLAVLGLKPVVEPVFAVEPIDAALPPFDALAFTSANGVREFARREARRDAAVFCVGRRTAEAARTAGFANVKSAEGDVSTLARLILGALPAGQKLLHSGNEDSVGDLVGQLRARDIAATFIATYRAAAIGKPGSALAAHLAGTPAFEAVLIHSARGAAILAEFLKASPAAGPIRVAAMSPAAGEPLRDHVQWMVFAAQPNEASLLKALTVLCDFG